MTVFVIDLYELNIRELLEVEHERTGDVIERSIRLAATCEINMRHAVGKLKLAVACETVEDER